MPVVKKLLPSYSGALVFLLTGCVTTVKTTPEVTLRAKVGRESVSIVAEVHSTSGQTLALVEHPEFLSMCLRAANRAQEDWLPRANLSWERPTADGIRVLHPSSQVTFESQIPFSRLPDGRLLVGGDAGVYGPPAFRTRSREWIAVFDYCTEGKQRLHLPWTWTTPMAEAKLHAEIPVTLP